MSTDKDGTQAEEWRFEANSFAPGWGLLYFGDEANSYAVEIMEARALAILADRRKAAQAEALAKALKSLPFPRCYDRDCIEVGVNEGNWITFKDGHTEPHKKDCPRYVIHAALASYASNPAEAGASEEQRR